MFNSKGTKVSPERGQQNPRRIPRDKLVIINKEREKLLKQLAKCPNDQDAKDCLADLVLIKHDPRAC